MFFAVYSFCVRGLVKRKAYWEFRGTDIVRHLKGEICGASENFEAFTKCSAVRTIFRSVSLHRHTLARTHEMSRELLGQSFQGEDKLVIGSD